MGRVKSVRAEGLANRWGARGPIIVAAVAASILLAASIAVAAWFDAAPGASCDVAPRTALEDYSWDELADIAAALSRCGSQEDAVELAARYGLCGEDGSLDASRVKEVELADGSTARVTVAGIWHDERSDGGAAGLTFAFLDGVGTHAMNHAFEDAQGDSADSAGGWAASDMRAWLNGDFLYELPADLRGRIAAVQKRTANAVGAADELDEPGRLAGSAADWVGETSDKLWLFSAVELCGAVPARQDMGVDATMAAVYGAEGRQYRLFSDAGVRAFATNGALARMVPGEEGPGTWWLRTKTLEFGDGFWLVGTDGTVLNGLGEDARVVDDPEFAPEDLWGPDHARVVFPGFCL